MDVITLSAGHEGFSWTIEGGVVEVVRVGDSIVRAPLVNPIQTDGNRHGREWWPARERFESLWRPLTFATLTEARDDFRWKNR